MAENESLDLGKSLRWRRVLRAMLDDRPAEEIATLVAVCLRQSVKALREPAGGRYPQVPLADLLDAAGDPREVDRIVRRCNGHDFVRLFRDSAAYAKTREEALVRYLGGMMEKFFDQIEYRAVQSGRCTFPDVRSRLDQVKALVKPDVERIARQLAANPKSSMPRSRSGAGSGTAINTESVLSESLLGD